MKLCIVFLVLTLFFIGGIQNASALRPIHIRTVPQRPITGGPTSIPMTTPKPGVSSSTAIRSSEYSWWHWATSTRHTNMSSSSSSPSTTHHHSSWWPKSNSCLKSILRIFLYIILIAIVCKIVGSVCKSKKPQKSNKNNSPVVLKNKLYVSTIDGKREEPPPSYIEIHNV